MNPWLLGALGGGSMLSGLLSAFGVGQDGGYQQVNPYTDQFYQDLLGEISRAQAAQQAGLNRSSEAQAEQSRVAGDIQRTTDQMGEVRQPGAMEWFENFLGSVPEYQRIAQQVGEQAVEVAGRDIQEQARLAQAQAISDAASQFTGQGFSGAAASAVGQAAANPIAQAASQMAQTQAGAQTQTFNQLAGQGQGLAMQGTQNEFTNALNALGQALQGQQLQAGIFGQQAGLGMNEAQMAANQVGQLMAARAQAAAPVYQQQQGSDPFGNLSQLLLGGLGLANMFGPNTNMG